MGFERGEDGFSMKRVDPFKPGPTEEEIMQEKLVEERIQAQYMKNYEIAGEIAELALTYVIKLCSPGARIGELCRRGDKFILQVLKERFPDRFNDTTEEDEAGASAAPSARPVKLRASQLEPKDGDVGVYYPTCISTDRVCGRHSPIPGAEPAGGARHGERRRAAPRLALGELAKVDVSVHVDGCVAAAAHTFIVDEPGRPTAVPSARQADVVLAAKAAASVAQELLRSPSPHARLRPLRRPAVRPRPRVPVPLPSGLPHPHSSAFRSTRCPEAAR